MILLKNVSKKIISSYEKKYVENLINNFEKIIKNCDLYIQFMLNTQFISVLCCDDFTKIKEKNNMKNLTDFIIETINLYFVKDIILFISELVYEIKICYTYSQNSYICQIPATIKVKTKNDILNFICKDINISKEEVTIEEKNIESFDSIKIISIISSCICIRYSILDFMIKIIKKELQKI